MHFNINHKMYNVSNSELCRQVVKSYLENAFYHQCYTLTGHSLILTAPENCGETKISVSCAWVFYFATMWLVFCIKCLWIHTRLWQGSGLLTLMNIMPFPSCCPQNSTDVSLGVASPLLSGAFVWRAPWLTPTLHGSLTHW